MSTPGYRPPAAGRAVTLGDPVTPRSGFVVDYEGERYVFDEGSWGRFGRDDDVCEIPVWEEVRHERLSRVAGELWMTDGQLWVRNLSGSHELGVFGDTGAPVWLPVRAAGERGRACSVPMPRGRLGTPTAGTWTITTEAIAVPDETAGHQPGRTARLGPVPEPLLPVAAALCAPVLGEPGAAATYEEVANRLGITRRQARRSVERLCAHYAGSLRRPRAPEEATTPTYAHLARLLVRRGLIARSHVEAVEGQMTRFASSEARDDD